MNKKTIYILLAIIVVVVLIIVFSGQDERVEIMDEPVEKLLTEKPEEDLTVETIEKEEEIPFFAKDVDLEISSDKRINIDKFRVKRGELINISLTNQDEVNAHTIKFDDILFKDFAIIVPAGKDEVRISSVTVPMKTGEYKFTYDEGESMGIMIVE